MLKLVHLVPVWLRASVGGRRSPFAFRVRQVRRRGLSPRLPPPMSAENTARLLKTKEPKSRRQEVLASRSEHCPYKPDQCKRTGIRDKRGTRKLKHRTWALYF